MMTHLRRPVRQAASRLLARMGYVAVPAGEWQHLRTMRRVHRNDVVEIEELYRTFLFPALPRDLGRIDAMHELHGTSVGEAVHIVHHLHKALEVEGDVCEFGCNEGATSRLLAHELLSHADRNLWLFDSFEGLPAPGKEDRLIDDIGGLGSIDRYEGTMRAREEQVRTKLESVGFPAERTRIVKGWIDQTLMGPSVPTQVSFAYIDFDFYEPIRLALQFLDRVMPPGGVIVVDDYGFFSAGAQAATDEFIAAAADRYTIHLPLSAAGKFCICERVA
ncbi:TylF/MycF/NovP-related O-methyltransferase [Muricoccus radiodurans]|uniref:TylF/MycF/NovP-related O-methyltransferase n=1 Tax=Muricoccus radiodurans TaxID=2231721 RepID=UPI003CED6C65